MKTFGQWIESQQNLPSVSTVKIFMPKILAAAQQAYDTWNQDDDGFDDELGAGGICQDIADAISGVLSDAGIECRTFNNNGVGDQHVWVVAKFKEGLYDIDIPPSEYENGSGYTWKKIPNVKFTARQVVVQHSYVSEEDYESNDW